MIVNADQLVSLVITTPGTQALCALKPCDINLRDTSWLAVNYYIKYTVFVHIKVGAQIFRSTIFFAILGWVFNCKKLCPGKICHSMHIIMCMWMTTILLRRNIWRLQLSFMFWQIKYR